MAVVMRATFFFKDTRGYGWTETVHSKKPDYTSTMLAAKRYLDLRRALLGTTARLEFVRVSDDLIKRDSLIYQVPPEDQNARGSSSAASDIANTCLVVRCDADPLSRRTLYMRGVPDSIVVNSGQYAPSEAFDQAFGRWADNLFNDQWAVRSKDPFIANHVIIDVTQALPIGNVTVTTADNHGFLQGQAITIRGNAQTGRSINGSWNVFSATATTFVIRPFYLLGNPVALGTCSRSAFVLNQIVNAEVRRVSHRIAGRPFDSPVGRRKARIRR